MTAAWVLLIGLCCDPDGAVVFMRSAVDAGGLSWTLETCETVADQFNAELKRTQQIGRAVCFLDHQKPPLQKKEPGAGGGRAQR